MADELTLRQRQVLRFIARYREKHGYSPSIRQICDGAGYRSTNGAAEVLDALERKDCITRDQMVARSILLTKRGEREVLQ